MNFITNASIKKRLTFVFLLAGIIPLCLVSLVTWLNNVDSLKHTAKNKLTLIGSDKTHQIEDLFSTMSKQAITLSAQISTIEAMENFTKSFEAYTSEFVDRPSTDEIKNSLTQFYNSQFSAKYKKINPTRDPIKTDLIFNQMSATGLSLQYNYLSNNREELGSKHLLISAEDGTSWSKHHKKYHPSFKKYLEEFAYYDIFLVSNSGDIVYSVFKELDFATNLKSGPYAQSNISEAFKKIASSESEDSVTIIDLKRYYPSFEAPAGFIGSPIFKNGQKIGALIFQVPVHKINDIMTSKNHWMETGFEKTGQAFIVGKDKILRTDDRILLESFDKFKKNISNLNQNPDDINYMLTSKTTATALHITGDVATASISDTIGFSKQTDVRGNTVLVYHRPIKISGLDWYTVAQKDESEAFKSLNILIKISAIIFAISICCLSLFAWLFSGKLSQKLYTIVKRIKDSAESTNTASSSVKSTSESVSSATTEQAASVQETVATLNEISAMVNKSVEYAKLSTEKSEACLNISTKGKESVSAVESAMNEINSSNEKITVQVNESNQQISGIVQIINEIADKTTVINDIVFQTKLLSFNASVEAARAGEHGKGFAVVAEEVGNLAQMSGSAAKEISELIDASIKRVESVVKESESTFGSLIEAGRINVEQGIRLTKNCTELLDNIVENASEVSKMMSEVTGGAQEQAEGVSNITIAMNEIDETTNSNADSAHKSFRSAEELAQSSLDLKGMVHELEQEIMGKDFEQKSLPIKQVSRKSPSPKKHTQKILEFKSPKKQLKKKSIPTTKVNSQSNNKQVAVGQDDNVPLEDDPRFEDI